MAYSSEDFMGRFGYHEQSSSELIPSVRSSPDLLKSAMKDTHFSSSAVRSIRDRDRDRDDLNVAVAPMFNQSLEFHEDPSFWKDHNVQVIIRIRPLSGSEISFQGPSRCVRQESSQTVTWTGPPESRFTFDLVADEHVSQEMLFKVAGVPMVENCMGGYNSCMFAYGQTGSGKTHTMLGDIDGGSRRHSTNSGMTPRVFEYLFSRIQKDKEARREEKLQFTCKCSFLEIYNEQILDLLDPSSLNLQIREDTKKGVYVENLKEIEVTSARDVIQQLVQGAANRKVASTNMNHASSRSHSVFTCIIESKWESQGVTHHRFARLNLVDLAGSERQKSSGAEGERLKEATNINKSLSTLGLVIMNLVNISNGKSLHVPYRDSKLTFLLQDSLGGNSKTTIIANISPSSCCSLETLSTLKFAQRAKFIKNHATVNEDASGDVLAMRIQIQQLKKEVSRLQNLVSVGAEKNEDDAWIVSFPGSPGSFKWEGGLGSFSPVTCAKRKPQKEDYEVALVAAFRRVKEKEITLQASNAESQAAMQLAKQREDEIKGLKMRLRFRESAIKRLEAVASGKIYAETHLLKEREEYLKEIEALRTQVNRSQEVTRFAMENLRLKEEIRRLKSFYEEGERERMNEQITMLQDKLLEALDWKLMHESEPSVAQKDKSDLAINVHSDDDFFVSLKDPTSPGRIEKSQLELPSLGDCKPNVALSDQIELQTMVDAIAAASQREAEAHETAIILSKENDELRIKLKMLIDDNNKLIELYERATAEAHKKETHEAEHCQEDNNTVNQVSEFAKKELEMKMKVESLQNQVMEMHEENDKLLGLYENAMQERDEFKRIVSSPGHRSSDGKINCVEKLVEVDEGTGLSTHERNHLESSTVRYEGKVLLEESGLVEVSVQDEYTRYSPQTNDYLEEVNEPPSFTELKNVKGCSLLEFNAQDRDVNMDLRVHTSSEEGNSFIGIENAQGYGSFKTTSHDSDVSMDLGEQTSSEEGECFAGFNTVYRSGQCPTNTEAPRSDELFTGEKITNNLGSVRDQLDKVQEMLLDSSQYFSALGSLERAIIEIVKLSRQTEELEDCVQEKQNEYAAFKLILSDRREREDLISRKLTALRYSMSNFSSSLVYFEQREIQARERANACSSQLNEKKMVLGRLGARKDEIEDAQLKIKKSEVELKKDIATLKLRIEEENKRVESDRVLIAIDNTENQWKLCGKATDLIKSEEAKTKLQVEMKQAREKLEINRKEGGILERKLESVVSEMQVAHMEMEKGHKSLEEMERKLESIIQEKEMVVEMKENGEIEYENLLLEYHQCVYEADLKEEEMVILEEELCLDLKRAEELQNAKSTAIKRERSRLIRETTGELCFVCDNVEEELQNLRLSFRELKSLLEVDN